MPLHCLPAILNNLWLCNVLLGFLLRGRPWLIDPWADNQEHQGHETRLVTSKARPERLAVKGPVSHDLLPRPEMIGWQ